MSGRLAAVATGSECLAAIAHRCFQRYPRALTLLDVALILEESATSKVVEM